MRLLFFQALFGVIAFAADPPEAKNDSVRERVFSSYTGEDAPRTTPGSSSDPVSVQFVERLRLENGVEIELRSERGGRVQRLQQQLVEFQLPSYTNEDLDLIFLVLSHNPNSFPREKILNHALDPRVRVQILRQSHEFLALLFPKLSKQDFGDPASVAAALEEVLAVDPRVLAGTWSLATDLISVRTRDLIETKPQTDFVLATFGAEIPSTLELWYALRLSNSLDLVTSSVFSAAVEFLARSDKLRPGDPEFLHEEAVAGLRELIGLGIQRGYWNQTAQNNLCRLSPNWWVSAHTVIDWFQEGGLSSPQAQRAFLGLVNSSGHQGALAVLITHRSQIADSQLRFELKERLEGLEAQVARLKSILNETETVPPAQPSENGHTNVSELSRGFSCWKWLAFLGKRRRASASPSQRRGRRFEPLERRTPPG